MKKKNLIVFLSVLIMLGCGASGNSAELNWESNLELALEKAAAGGKAVLVNFTGSDWCGWCIKLKNEVFSKPEFKEYAEASLILVELDFPRALKQSEETKQYNQNKLKEYKIEGFPTVLLLDDSGKVLLRTGYLEGGAAVYVSHLEKKRS